jgi:exopolyphosphatase/guanosine-5'-triphosphate,3'-diphosphate pyrophosphatase
LLERFRTAVHWGLHHGGVPIGVVDVGSNTVRLHVAGDGDTARDARSLLGLGEAIERFGSIPPEKLDEVVTTVAGYVAKARSVDADPIEVLVTSPGRQAANGAELVSRLEDATHVPVRVLSAVDEARFGFVGALAGTRLPAGRRVAVVDVGGGSAQIAIGTPGKGPAWIRSIDIGSMRLTSRCVTADPPGLEALARARVEVERALEGLDPPHPRVTFAVGGSARAVRRVIGNSRFGRDELAEAIELLAGTPAAEVAGRFDIEPGRARTLPAGAVILAGIADLLDTRLRIGRGGVREGAAVELERRRAAA